MRRRDPEVLRAGKPGAEDGDGQGPRGPRSPALAPDVRLPSRAEGAFFPSRSRWLLTPTPSYAGSRVRPRQSAGPPRQGARRSRPQVRSRRSEQPRCPGPSPRSYLKLSLTMRDLSAPSKGSLASTSSLSRTPASVKSTPSPRIPTAAASSSASSRTVHHLRRGSSSTSCIATRRT